MLTDMSSDQQMLAAIAMKTNQDMRYFERIKAICGTKSWTCYICLGKHAVFFLQQDLTRRIHDGWQLFYAHIKGVVQDKTTRKWMRFELNDNKDENWETERLFVQSENRALLLQHLAVNWQTDYMWRLGRVSIFPLSTAEITTEKVEPVVLPFIDHSWREFNQYRFMLQYDFKDQPNAIQADNTGEYVNPQGVSVVVQVHEAMTLDQLTLLRRDHIRWVASEYRIQLVSEEKTFYILRNQQRQKRMNLTGDMSSWHGWEIIIRTPKAAIICLLSRRQYIPPVCNSAQDVGIIMRVPAGGENKDVPNFKQMLLEAHLISDSLCPEATSMPPYRDVVQAKVDALRYDEESFAWIKSHLKLDTRWRKHAKAWVKAILTIYVNDLGHGLGEDKGDDEEDLYEALEETCRMDDCGGDYDNDDSDDFQDATLEKIKDSMIDHLNDRTNASTLLKETDDDQDKVVQNRVRHYWQQRVARYLAWAVDGGVMGAKFTLDIMVQHITQLKEASFKKVESALSFMLHMREKDMDKRYQEAELIPQIRDQNLKDWTFNDRVMQAILSQEYLKKQLGRQKEAWYFECLAHLLQSNASTNLKAYVCRIFMERVVEKKDAQSEEANRRVVPALRDVLEEEGTFLATYASAALVNLSDGDEKVKTMLMSGGIAGLATQNLKTKDDELICYTLMLLVNLTKQPHHRSVIASGGLLPLLYDILTSTYHQCGASSPGKKVSSVSVAGGALKEKLLTQVCILIGHFAIDDGYRLQFLDKDLYGFTVKCLLYIFDCAPAPSPLMCWVMFALKQLCKDDPEQKQEIGAHCIKRMVERLQDKPHEKGPQFIFQSLLLFQMLATHPPNCQMMKRHSLNDVMSQTVDIPACKRGIKDFKEKVERLIADVERETCEDMLM